MAREHLRNGHHLDGESSNGHANGRISEQDLRAWLDAYGRAWRAREPLEAASLFSEDASYQITPSPFAEPLRGRDAILSYWVQATIQHREVHFDYEVLAVAERTGIARWSALMSERGLELKVDGILVVSLTEDKRCCELREWWSGEDAASG